MPDPQEYQRKVAAAVMKAIFDASITEIDGKPTAYIATAEVMEALVNVMASMMEGHPLAKRRPAFVKCRRRSLEN